MRASQAARGALTRSYVVEKKSSVCSTFEGRGKEKRRKGEGDRTSDGVGGSRERESGGGGHAARALKKELLLGTLSLSRSATIKKKWIFVSVFLVS